MSVLYRMFAVTPGMEPIERDAATQTDASIAIEFVVSILSLKSAKLKVI